MENKANRTYHSKIRQQQAKETKDRIADAADKLVKANGYESTTIGHIAAEAGVASQTVYAVFGSKRGIILYLMTRAIRRIRPGNISRCFAGCQSDAQFYSLLANDITNALVSEREAISSAGGISMLYPELMELIKEADTRRRTHIESSMERLKKVWQVFPENDEHEDKRLDLVWSLLDGHILHGLVFTMGWSVEDFELVLGQLLKFICTEVDFKKPQNEAESCKAPIPELKDI